jgi:hypothetical protein
MKSDMVTNRINMGWRATGVGAFRAESSPAQIQRTDNSTATVSSGINKADFTDMTRQEMRDWVNDQIRAGRMSLDESTPFVGMTLRVSMQDLKPIDSSTDSVRVNFIENARSGIEGAFSRNDQDEAKRLQAALDLMVKYQRQAIAVDTHA